MTATAAAGPLRPAAIERRVPVALAAATVAAQIAYPLTPLGAARDALTVATVVLFFAASVSHAAVWRGARFAAALVAVTTGGGLLVEALGVATSVPFGAYRYTGTLGWQLLGVPVVIPLAWTMMAYPALLVGDRIGRRRTARVVAAGAALASWDLFLDPQMVDAGHWVWRGGAGPALVGVPVSNFVGWFVVATAMMAVLARVPQRGVVEAVFTPTGGGRAMRWSDAYDDRVPYALYLWTYASSVLAHAAFFNLPGSALLGGAGMGVVVALFLRALRRGS